jgi:integrase/recombinase XerD
MSKLWISLRTRADRPGKWIVDVRRGTERHPRTFENFEEANDFAKQVRHAEKRGELKHLSPPKPQTLAALCEAFLKTKTYEGLAESTLTTYRNLLKQTVLPRIGPQLHPREVTQEQIESYRDQRLHDGLTGTTVYREMDRLRALLGYAKQQGLVSKNVAESVKRPKLREEPKDWLRSNEIGPFLDACSSDFASIARFTIFTGLRRREVVFLQRSDIDLINGVIQIRAKPGLGFRPKSGQERSVPLDPTLRPLVERHSKERVKPGLEAWVFGTRDGSRRSPTTRWFAVSVQQAARQAGITRLLTFHDLRRTYGAMLLESGVDIYSVSKLLGHSDVRITQKVYAPLCGKFLASEASKLGRYLAPSLIREISLHAEKRSSSN